MKLGVDLVLKYEIGSKEQPLYFLCLFHFRYYSITEFKKPIQTSIYHWIK